MTLESRDKLYSISLVLLWLEPNEEIILFYANSMYIISNILYEIGIITWGKKYTQNVIVVICTFGTAAKVKMPSIIVVCACCLSLSQPPAQVLIS